MSEAKAEEVPDCCPPGSIGKRPTGPHKPQCMRRANAPCFLYFRGVSLPPSDLAHPCFVLILAEFKMVQDMEVYCVGEGK